jgi:hypothetical protein
MIRKWLTAKSYQNPFHQFLDILYQNPRAWFLKSVENFQLSENDLRRKILLAKKF